MSRARGAAARVVARKRFGQHFLRPEWIPRLVHAIEPDPDDQVIEIGPGAGALTLALAPRVRRIIGVEIDRDLVGRLRSSAPPNVTVVEADVLRADLATLMPGEAPPRVVGNLPYYISSPILSRLITTARGGSVLRDATLMLQAETADRLIAERGAKEYGVLTVLTTLHAGVARLLKLPPGAFRPPPKVWSALVRLTFHPPSVPVPDAARFEDVVKASFSQRRKTLQNALSFYASRIGCSAADLLHDAGIDPRRRAETLTLEEFASLAVSADARGGARR